MQIANQTLALRPEVQAAITRVSETFSKLGCCTAEGLGFVLAAESAGGVQPAVPLVNMLKKAAETVEAFEERGVAATKEALGKEAGNNTVNLSNNSVTSSNVLKAAESTLAPTLEAINKTLTFTDESLQHMFSRHCKDFGMTKNWCNATKTEFEAITRTHVQKCTPIPGTFRKNHQALHYFDPETKINISTRLDGSLLGGWKLSPAQEYNVLTTGDLK